MTDPLILLVEDDAVIREATQLNLERNGFRVITASGGLTGMDMALDAKPDIAVLDVMLPDLNGISLCRRIREELSVPVIMLSARDDPVDIVLGLEAGADDYVTKPFDSGVLVARIRSVLRRVESHSGTEKDIVTLGDLEIDRELVTVMRSGAEVALTPTEMKLLLVMVSVPRKVWSRSELLSDVWDYDWGGDTRIVDVHVQRLRTKIGSEQIRTVRGFGYTMDNHR